jgi:hypothetical protein
VFGYSRLAGADESTPLARLYPSMLHTVIILTRRAARKARLASGTHGAEGPEPRRFGATTINGGLRVESALDTRAYQKGIKVGKAEMNRLGITGDPFHPQ